MCFFVCVSVFICVCIIHVCECVHTGEFVSLYDPLTCVSLKCLCFSVCL